MSSIVEKKPQEHIKHTIFNRVCVLFSQPQSTDFLKGDLSI